MSSTPFQAVSSWPERAHHRRILSVLEKLDGDLLAETGTCFGGGTAISMLSGEYRRSDDIDFLCVSFDGFNRLRGEADEKSLGAILKADVPILNSRVKIDRYGIRCVFLAGGEPIKFEILAEERFTISPEKVERMPVPVLSLDDMITAKIYAVTDRWFDRSKTSRDALDLGMLSCRKGGLTSEIWSRIPQSMRQLFVRGIAGTLRMLHNRAYFHEISKKMDMSFSDMARSMRALRRDISSLDA